jgi:hypothetical protein
MHAGEDFHGIGFGTGGGEGALSGAAAVEFDLDVGGAQGEAGRATVYYGADGGAVAFAKGGDAEELSEGVAHAGGE